MGGAGGRLGILAMSMLFLRGTYRGAELADEFGGVEEDDGEAFDVGALDVGAFDAAFEADVLTDGTLDEEALGSGVLER